MPQYQCPWCGKLGLRWEREPEDHMQGEYGPHADGSRCVCRHVNSSSRAAALRNGGRYWDGSQWVCTQCGTAPPATDSERRPQKSRSRRTVEIREVGVLIATVTRARAERLARSERDHTGCWGDGASSYTDITTGERLTSDGTWQR